MIQHSIDWYLSDVNSNIGQSIRSIYRIIGFVIYKPNAVLLLAISVAAAEIGPLHEPISNFRVPQYEWKKADYLKKPT